MILEGLVTTLDAVGAAHLAPMGPRFNASMESFTLRPFRTAQTFRNLRQHPEGVFHITDDVLLVAQAAVGAIDPPPATLPAGAIRGYVLADACRAFEFRITSVDETQERVTMQAEVMAARSLRDFAGFNRAKHAVVEAAILATRVHILARSAVQEELRRLAPWVEKTGGPREAQAFAFLCEYIERQPAPQAS